MILLSLHLMCVLLGSCSELLGSKGECDDGVMVLLGGGVVGWCGSLPRPHSLDFRIGHLAPFEMHHPRCSLAVGANPHWGVAGRACRNGRFRLVHCEGEWRAKAGNSLVSRSGLPLYANYSK
jgi:hypothetical protein